MTHIRWKFAECLDCYTTFRYYRDSREECPSCGGPNWEIFSPADDDCCCCDNCRERVGVNMRSYNVVLSAGIEIESQVEAESEEKAREIAKADFDSMDIYAAIEKAGYVSSTSAEVVESWVNDEEN